MCANLGIESYPSFGYVERGHMVQHFNYRYQPERFNLWLQTVTGPALVPKSAAQLEKEKEMMGLSTYYVF